MEKIIALALLMASVSAHSAELQDCAKMVEPLYAPMKRCIEKGQDCGKEIAARIIDITALCAKENGEMQPIVQQQAQINQLKKSN